VLTRVRGEIVLIVDRPVPRMCPRSVAVLIARYHRIMRMGPDPVIEVEGQRFGIRSNGKTARITRLC
jgi:hypothetical protein